MSRRKRSQEARELIPFMANILNGRGGAARTVIRNGDSGGAGVADHGALTGLGDDDHSLYLRVDGNRAMSGNLNLANNDIVNVRFINGLLLDDFVDDLLALQADVVALQGRTVYGGDGLTSDLTTLGAGSPTLDIDLAFDFDWTGDHTHTGTVGAAIFSSTDPITGWRINAGGDAWFANIEATSLSVKTFISDVTLALQGSQLITKSKAEVSRNFTTPSTTGTLYVMDLPGQPDSAVFEVGDYVRLRYVYRDTGLQVGDVWGTVSAYTDLGDGEQSWTFTRTAGDVGQTIYAGMVALDYGKSGDGYVELSSLGSDAPFVVVRTWTSNPALAGNHVVKAVLGNLAGVTDAEMGALSGYGLYTDNASLNGALVAGDGAVHVNVSGISIDAGSAAGDVNMVKWLVDAGDASSEMLGSIFTVQSGSPVTTWVRHAARWGGSSGSDEGLFEINVDEDAVTGVDARFYIQGKAAPEATLHLANGATRGTFNIAANVSTTGHLVPLNDSTVDLGSASKYFRALYVDTIYAGTTSSTDTGHNHNNLYYTEAEVDTLLAGKSNVGHSHAGYVTSLQLATELADYVDDAALAVALSSYYTKVAADSLLATKSNTGHSHALADLSERAYGSLTSRGHVLASTTGLGADHSVAGLTVGMVLRATSADAARFMALNYADLANRTHDIANEHVGDLPWNRVDLTGSDIAQLETRAYTALTDRTHLITGGDHSITAARYSVVGTPAADNVLGVWASTSDGANNANTLLRSGDNNGLSIGPLTVAGDLTLPYWELNSATGVIQTTDPYAFRPPSVAQDYLGIRFTPSTGSVEARALLADRFFAETMVWEQVAVNAGDFLIAKSGGRLREELTISTKHNLVDSSGNQLVDSAGNAFVVRTNLAFTVKLENPVDGAYDLLEVGDQIIIAGRPTALRWAYGGGVPHAPSMWYPASVMSPASTMAPIQVRAWITAKDGSEANTYTAQARAERWESLTFPAGCAVASFGSNGEAYIYMVSRNKSAYIDIGRLPGTEWGDELERYIRLGDIGDLPAVAEPGEIGLVGGAIEDGAGAYFKITPAGTRHQNGVSVVTDAGGNAMAAMTASGINLRMPEGTMYPANQADWLTDADRFRTALTFVDNPENVGTTYGAVYGTRSQNFNGTWNSHIGIMAQLGPDDFATRVDLHAEDGDVAGITVQNILGTTGLVTIRASDSVTVSSERTTLVGRLQLSGLPSNPFGLSSGETWVDNGLLRVVP